MRRIGLHALAALLLVWTSLACSPSASTERVVVLESEPVATAPTDDVALCFGRLVDPQGRPVSNATVELGYDGRVLGHAVTRESGEFELRGTLVRTEPLVPFLLTARASDDELARLLAREPHTFRVGVGSHDHDPRGVELGQIVLEPTHTLEVRLAGAQGPIEVEAHTYDSTQRPFEFIGWAPAARAHASGDGTLQLRGLPAGWIQVTAGDGANGACECVQVPLTTTVELNLEPLRTCDVTVRDAQTRAPIADAEVTLRVIDSQPCSSATPPGVPKGALGYSSLVWPQLRRWAAQPSLRTNGFGFVRVTGLPPGKHYECRVSASGSRHGSPGYVARQVTLRSPDGVHEILLQPQRLKTLRWGIVDAYEKRPADGTVIRLLRCTSEGELLPVPDLEGRMENGELVVYDVPEEDSLDFLAIAPNGARARVSYSAGRNPLAYAFVASPRTVRVTLRDTQGRPVKSAGVVAEYENTFTAESFWWLPRHSRTDEFGIAVLEDLLPEPVQVFAKHRVNGIDEGPWPHKQLLGEFDLFSCTTIALEATLRPPSCGIATVRIDGRPALPNEFTCTPEPIWPPPEDGRLSFVFGWPESDVPVTINFNAPGLIPATATVTPSPDGSPVHFNLDLFTECALRVRVPRLTAVELTAERFETASGAWEEAAHSLGPPVAVTDEWLERRVGQLRPGRWRLVEKRSGMRSTEIELSAELREGAVEIDLPAPLEAEEAATGASGELRVPIAPSKLHSRWSLRVAATPAGATVEHLKWFDAPLIDGTARTTEIGAGEWTLWIDPGDGWAAQRVERVAVSELGAQLRPLIFERGSSIFVRLQHAPGVVPPQVEIVAEQLDAPFLTRTHRSNFESTVEFPGLCAGRYRVYVSDVLSTNPGAPREVELNGGDAVTIDWAP